MVLIRLAIHASHRTRAGRDNTRRMTFDMTHVLRSSLVLTLVLFGVSPLFAAQQPAEGAQRGWIGITFKDDGGQQPIVIAEVMPEAPAEAAGLQAGDRIVIWNGRRDVAAAVRDTPLQVGDTVELRVSRSDGSERTVTIVATRRPVYAELLSGRLPRIVAPGSAEFRFVLPDSALAFRDSLWTSFGNTRVRVLTPDSTWPRGLGDGSLGVALALGRNAVAGAELADISPGLATYFGTDQGVLVLRVAPNTPAGRAGLQDGDVILGAGDQTIRNVAELRWALSRPGGGDVELDVLRQGGRRTVVLGR